MKQVLLIVLLCLSISLFCEWTIVQTFPIPESASGLAWDGTNLYTGIYGSDGDQVYQINPADGTYSLLFSGPQEDAFGMSFDGEYLWVTDHPGSISDPAIAMQLDFDGTLISQFNLPDHYMSGIAYDNGNFWVSSYYDPDGYIYKLDSSGTILQEFTAPDNQPWDLCIENDNLWMADYWGDALYQINPLDGSLLESHPSEGEDPAGIVFDGQFLWYIDAGSGYNVDFLYKVDLGGAGAPVIEITETEYDFGNVTTEEYGSWSFSITNNGTADLEINDFSFTDNSFSTNETTPITIEPGSSSNVEIQFNPSNWGNFYSLLIIHSNDPVNPEEEIELFGYGLMPDQEIVYSPETIDFGTIRAGGSTGEFITFSNQGNALLSIESIESSSEFFYQDNMLELPLELNPRDTIMVRIWFNPASDNDYQGILTIESNDADESQILMNLYGTGIEQEWPLGSLLWDYQINAGYDNSPKSILSIGDINNDLISDLIVGSEDHHLRCFNGASSNTADVLWDVDMGSGYIYSQKGLITGYDINNDTFADIVIGTSGGTKAIIAFDAVTGNQLWMHNTNDFGDGGWVYQVDWQYDYNGDEFPDVLAATGDDASDTGPKRVYCLDGLDGTTIWTYAAGGPVFSVTAINDITGDYQPDVIAGASDAWETTGKVYAINGNNGNMIWSFDTEGSSVWAVAVVDDFNDDEIDDVIAGDFSGYYYGFNGVNGNLEWSQSMGGFNLITRFQIMEDINGNLHPDILIEHSGNSAYTFDPVSGNNIWSQYLGDNSLSVASIPDITGDGVNEALIGCLNNNAYFLDGHTGSVLSSINLSTPVDAIGIIPDITNDQSWEMIAGGRNGLVACISGGIEIMVETHDEIIPNSDIISHGNWPNPFNSSGSLRSPATEICFSLKSSSDVEIIIFNLKGQQIKRINSTDMSEGFHQVSWDGADDENNPVGSGIYLYRINSANSSVVNKMVKVR